MVKRRNLIEYCCTLFQNILAQSFNLQKDIVGMTDSTTLETDTRRVSESIDRAADMCALMLEFAREGPLDMRFDRSVIASCVMYNVLRISRSGTLSRIFHVSGL